MVFEGRKGSVEVSESVICLLFTTLGRWRGFWGVGRDV